MKTPEQLMVNAETERIIKLINKRIAEIEGNGHTVITTEICRELRDLKIDIKR